VVERSLLVRLELVELVVVVLEQQRLAQLPELLIRVVAVVEAAQIHQVQQVEQAALVSSSLNTSPNLITKSSNHQAHGLHLPELPRWSTK
jgi:hypothetical protein